MANMPSPTLIVAATLANGIGRGGHLPWHLSQDMTFFAHVTKSAPPGSVNAVIMGRNTWESIPPKNRPLKGRMNIIISRNTHYLEETAQDPGIVSVKSSLQDAILTDLANSLHRIFIIGGASIYKAALEPLASPSDSSHSPVADRILMTRIFSPAFEDCDVFFPEFRDMKAGDGAPVWTQSTHDELETWVGREVPRGKQEEKGIKYEFQMWTRKA